MGLKMWWRSLVGQRRGKASLRPMPRRLGGRWAQARPHLERLEDRVVPATTRWVDNTPGTAGTEFTASGGTQPASVPGLTPGVTLFSTIQAAVNAASAGDT